MRHQTRAALTAALTLLAACGDSAFDPNSQPVEPSSSESPLIEAGTATAAALRSRETPASVGWNALTQDLILKYRSNPADGARIFSYLSAAQYQAVMAASEPPRGRGSPSLRAAAAAASVVILGYQYPAEVANLEALLTEQRNAEPGPGQRHKDFAAGEAIGREIGAKLVERARNDGFADATQVPPPVGPQFWFRIMSPLNPPPYKPLLGTNARPWFLTSGAQFRAAPPPAFESAEFKAGLDEVRQVAASRTPEQDSIARLWDMTVPASIPGAITPMGGWNARARGLIASRQLGERRAAKILALMNMAGWDAFIGCWDSKYHYWLARPHMADPSIRWVSWLPFVPPHPSYPSGHSCMTSAATTVLSVFFPFERRALDAESEEASVSRLYAGIHYRFDMVAGDRLGSEVARWVISQHRASRHDDHDDAEQFALDE